MIQNTLIVNNGIDTSNATATAGDVLNGNILCKRHKNNWKYSNKNLE